MNAPSGNKVFLIVCAVGILAGLYFSGQFSPGDPYAGTSTSRDRRPDDPPGPNRLTASERQTLNARLAQAFPITPNKPIVAELAGFTDMGMAFERRHDEAYFLLKYMHPKTQHYMFESIRHASFISFVGTDGAPKILLHNFNRQLRNDQTITATIVEGPARKATRLRVLKLAPQIFLIDDILNVDAPSRLEIAALFGNKLFDLSLDDGFRDRGRFLAMVFGKPLTDDAPRATAERQPAQQAAPAPAPAVMPRNRRQVTKENSFGF